MPNLITPVGGSTMPLVQDAAVGDEIEQAGIGLGLLVKKTGEAIANTQELLNDTGARTASALAETLVDVIAVEEKVYLDDGTLDTSQSHTIEQKLPLITFIDPVFYQWSNVRLQGRYMASEFASEQNAETASGSSRSRYGQSGFQLLLGGGFNNNQSSNSQVSRNIETTRDTSYGQMRMNTLLEPRDDVKIPKPNQVVQGPRLSILKGEISDIAGGEGQPPIIARTMSVIIQFNKRDGSPIADKILSVEASGVPWSYVGDRDTNELGQVEILLRRDFMDEGADTSPADFKVSARIGLVNNTVTVTF